MRLKREIARTQAAWWSPDDDTAEQKAEKREAKSERDLSALCFRFLLSFMSLSPSAFAAFEDVGTGARPRRWAERTRLWRRYLVTAVHPASLARLKQVEIASEYSRLFTGLTDGSNIYQYFVGVGIPVKSSGTLRWDGSNSALAVFTPNKRLI